MTDPTPGLGLYSIGVRGLDVPELLTCCAHNAIPFLHLRGGARGHELADAPEWVLDAWRAAAQDTVPITMVTADITLDDLLHADPVVRDAANRHLRHTATAAHRLGSGAVRILSAVLPRPHQLERAAAPDLGLRLLVELHDPSWWTPAGVATLDTLEATWPAVKPLADSAQAHRAVETHGGLAGEAITQIADRSVVVHLSDHGAGLGGAGHRLLARAVRQTAATTPAREIAFEWTGADRSAGQCLRRYQQAAAWWDGPLITETGWPS